MYDAYICIYFALSTIQAHGHVAGLVAQSSIAPKRNPVVW